MAVAVVADGDGDDAAAVQRRSDDRLWAIKRWCDQRAARKRDMVLRIAPLRYLDMPHEKVRLRVGLTVGEYRRAKQWLNEAVGRCAASAHPMTMAEALDEMCAEQIVACIRVGMFREQGATREQIREKLNLSDAMFDIADEWYRDALTAASEPEPAE